MKNKEISESFLYVLVVCLSKLSKSIAMIYVTKFLYIFSLQLIQS